MSQVRYLIDESLWLSTVAAMRRIEPSLDVHRVGQAEMPPFGTPDPDILSFCEKSHRLLVTPGCSFRQLLDDLLLIWSCTAAEEWRDAIHYLPLP